MDVNNRARSKTFDRKRDAEQFLHETSTDIARGEWVDPRKRRELFDDWSERWWETTVKLRPTTRRGYWGVLERHVRPHFNGRKLAEIDYVDVEEFIADRLKADLSPKYVRECVTVLSLIMRLAVRANMRRDNPAAGHQLEIRRRKIREGDVRDMDQINRLIEQVKEPYKPAIWLMVLGGLRPAELCGLRVGSIDFARHVVHVTETLLPVHKYGTTAHQSAVTGPPKSEAGNRSIPIPQWLSDELAELLAARAAKSGTAPSGDDHLFLTPKGLPLHRDRFRQSVVRPALVAAGLPETLRTYDLRHSHASLLIDMGANVLAVSQRMGHVDPSVTLREYGHLFEGTQEKLTEQLDGLRMATAKSTTASNVVPLKRPS